MREDAPIYLSVVIPVFNEKEIFQKVLADLLRELSRQFPDDFEIIIVDDASTDGLDAVVPKFSGPIKYAQHAQRSGSGAARVTGTRLARGTICGWIDGDGTYKVQDLAMIAKSLDPFDQVIGVRSDDFGAFRVLRLAVKWLAKSLASVLWRRSILDLNSGIRVFKRETMNGWLHLLPKGFSCTTTATLAALNARQRVGFKSVAYCSRQKGSASKFHPVLDTFRLFRTILRLRFS